jgi:anti-anti-sigma regulatory factor
MFKHTTEHISATFLHHVYLKLLAVSAIDTSGISLFKELKATLEKKGVEVRIFNSEIYFDLFTHLNRYVSNLNSD